MAPETPSTLLCKPYEWEVCPTDTSTIIYAHALDRQSNYVVLKIPDFQPCMYVELDPKIQWNRPKLQILRKYITDELVDDINAPVSIVYKSKLKNYAYKPGHFLRLTFKSPWHISRIIEPAYEGARRQYEGFRFKINKKNFKIPGIGNAVQLIPHEFYATPDLQLYATQNIKPTSWIHAERMKTTNYHFSTAHTEMICSYKSLKKAKDQNLTTNPRICSYDIECISGQDPSGLTFPDKNNISDITVCICATVGREQDPESKWKQYALVNVEQGRDCPDIDGCKVLRYKNETALLLGWSNFLKTVRPNIVIGYNSLSFDDNYLIVKSKLRNVWDKYASTSYINDRKAQITATKWKSEAYGDQEYVCFDVPGILHIDIYYYCKKEFRNLSSYSLNDVSEHFLGDRKIDLPPDIMIQKWHQGGSNNMHDIVEYCVKDTLLPFKLLKKLNIWIGLNEMANVMCLHIYDLLTRGEQLRLYAQMYYLTRDLNVVMTAKGTEYKTRKSDEPFIGATVQNPKCGLWNNVATFDFASLYPSIIITYNLCPSTFIQDTHPEPAPGTFNIIKFESHRGCEHDTGITKTKIAAKDIVCRKHSYRFYKKSYKKGLLPILLEKLLAARAHTKKQLQALSKRKDLTESEELMKVVLDQRQQKYKISANSGYGGLGSDFSQFACIEAAATVTAMGRRSIQKGIDAACAAYPETIVVYGDTDSCMLKFGDADLKRSMEICDDLENIFAGVFEKPMSLDFEKMYGLYLLLTKKKYIGYKVDREGNRYAIDKAGVILKRRDNCDYIKRVYGGIVDMVMARKKWYDLYDFLEVEFRSLLRGEVPIEDLIITMELKDKVYKTKKAHVEVAEKMKSRGKFVIPGTRIKYVYIDTGDPKAKEYQIAEDPDYVRENKSTVKMNYIQYIDKFTNGFDEIFELIFGKTNVVKNFVKYYKTGDIDDPKQYFNPVFNIRH